MLLVHESFPLLLPPTLILPDTSSSLLSRLSLDSTHQTQEDCSRASVLDKMDSQNMGRAQELLDMFLPDIMALSAAYDAGDEPGRDRPQKRRSTRTRARRAAPTTPTQPPVPVPDHLNNPLVAIKPKGVKLPYLDKKAIELTRKDYDCKERKVPTSHPDGPRHARIYTLIGRGSSAPLRQRGTPSRPAPNAEGILRQRPQPLATPALDTQAGPSRTARTQGRTDPYAETSTRSRVTGSRRN
ncbi:hypothetical protein H4Q26_014402 [Puccinia striiformis f. sp. tritici PST-130]|nr:hypothetical protein H4Q26_014402 [Puccinia striiformis f. sp. tritici PST-130]